MGREMDEQEPRQEILRSFPPPFPLSLQPFPLSALYFPYRPPFPFSLFEERPSREEEPPAKRALPPCRLRLLLLLLLALVPESGQSVPGADKLPTPVTL